jgi:nucleoside-diphosphate-sugar epimerase
MATAAAAAGVRRFVLMSSGAINGTKGLGRPFVETDLPDPASHYGRSKQEAEEVLQQVCAGSDLQYVCLRPPVLVGAGSPGNIAAVLKAITTGLPLPLAGIDNRRSYLGIGNLCDLVALALTHPGAANQVFMATDEPSLSTEALVRMLARHLGRSPRLFPVPLAAIKAVAALTGRTASLRPLWASLELDASKAVRQLGWRRQQSLESAMAEAAAALRLGPGRGTREPGASKEGSGRQTIGAGRENS